MEYQKQPKQLVILLVIKLLIKLQKFCNSAIQKQLQINMVNNYLKKDVYLQKKDRRKTITNKPDKYLPKERYISPEERQKEKDWWSDINIIL